MENTQATVTLPINEYNELVNKLDTQNEKIKIYTKDSETEIIVSKSISGNYYKIINPDLLTKQIIDENTRLNNEIDGFKNRIESLEENQTNFSRDSLIFILGLGSCFILFVIIFILIFEGK